MKKIILLLVFFGQFLAAQKQQVLEFPFEEIQIPNRSFYIEDVQDTRPVKSVSIGVIHKGIFNIPYQAVLENGLENALFNYYENTLLKEKRQLGIYLKISKLHVFEKAKQGYRLSFANVSIEYYYQNQLLFSNEQEVKAVGRDIGNSHAKNIEEALQKSLFEFSYSDWESKTQFSFEGEKEVVEKRTFQKRQVSKEETGKDVLAIGYQIGGYALIGFEYEFRISDFIGLNLGGGVQGMTAGLKLHANASKNSPFINVNFKDGGFGLLNTRGVDLGGRIVLDKSSDFALHLQVCYAVINSIDSEFEYELYGYGEDAPKYFFTFGAGFSW
jgi:hypothetical protein